MRQMMEDKSYWWETIILRSTIAEGYLLSVMRRYQSQEMINGMKSHQFPHIRNLNTISILILAI